MLTRKCVVRLGERDGRRGILSPPVYTNGCCIPAPTLAFAPDELGACCCCWSAPEALGPDGESCCCWEEEGAAFRFLGRLAGVPAGVVPSGPALAVSAVLEDGSAMRG